MRKHKLKLIAFTLALVAFTLGITGPLKGIEASINSKIWTEEGGTRILSENEAKEVKKIWRVISDQEIVNWDGKEWLTKTEAQKKEVIKSACEAWRKAGYQRIESIKYFIEDIDKYYRHFEQKNPEESMKTKVGLVLSLSALFSRGLR